MAFHSEFAKRVQDLQDDLRPCPRVDVSSLHGHELDYKTCPPVPLSPTTGTL